MTVRPCHLDGSRECYADANYRIRCEMNKEKAEKWDRYLAVLSDPELEGEQEIMDILVKCAENAKHLKSAKELAKQMYVTECESSQMNRLVRTLYGILEAEWWLKIP